MTDEDIIDGIIDHEGSAYTNRSADRGGPTRFGITQSTLAKWRKCPVTPAEVASLSEGEARQIYESIYITEPGFSKIADDAVRVQAIDFGVNSGPGNAVKSLQGLLGLACDGVLGPKTQSAVNAFPDQARLNINLAKARLKFLASIVHDSPGQAENINGWVSRAISFF
ncbi:MAG: glycosyl hydrolase 108 family protein [Parvibaculaceae bacterium]|nr:glycosyl hydrolase 108 family protein [Parvibaculaceae bacterium]